MPHELHCCYEKCLCDDKRSTRSQSSVRTYCYNICWLAKRMDGFSETDLPDPENVIKYCEDNDVSLKRRQMSYSSMKVLHNARDEIAQSRKYAAPLTDVKHKLTAELDKQERTERQKACWVDFHDLKKNAKMLTAETVALDKNSLWTKEQFARAQLAFILTFHIKYPIRRDLCSVQYGVPETDNEGNKLIGKEIVLRDHKVKKFIPEFRFRLDRTMWRLVQLLRKQHALRGITSGFLLLNRYWKRMHPNSYTNWMKREMGKLESWKGKSSGCLAIRHSVITHRRRNDSTLEKRKEFARCCMHGIAQSEHYRVH